MLKAIFFDLDNTLYDYDAADKVATRALYNEFCKDIPLTFEEFNQKYSEAKSEIKRELIGSAASHNRILYLQRLTEKTHQTVNPSRILALYHAYWDTLVENSSVFPGVIALFQFLQKNSIKIALVTNLTAYVQIRKINSLGISDYVDYLVTSEESGYDKPHPSSFLLALHKCNLLPEQVIMVGDDPISDLEGAKALQIPTVHYRFGKHAKNVEFKERQKPTYSVQSHKELQEIISRLLKTKQN